MCANCGRPFEGQYCPACGQKAAPIRQPLHHFLGEAITEYFGIDGRLWTSLKLLILRPGRLTQDYLAGRRVRYLRPLRLYLSATLAFFFVLAVLDPVGEVEGAITGDTAAAEPVPVAVRVAELDSVLAASPGEVARQERLVDSLQQRAARLRTASDSTAPPEVITSSNGDLEDVLDELGDETGDLSSLRLSASRQRRLRQLRWQRDQLAAFPPDSLVRVDDWAQAAQIVFPRNDVNINLPAWMPRSRPVQRLMEARTGEERGAALADFARGAIGQIPTVMFLLLPVFALLLKLIYIRRDWFYSEHLVFALHTHAFAFIVFAIAVALLGFGGDAAWAGVAAWLLMFTIPVYFFVAQKRVYGQGWLKTGFKAYLLGGMYAFVLLAGMVLAIVLASAL